MTRPATAAAAVPSAPQTEYAARGAALALLSLLLVRTLLAETFVSLDLDFLPAAAASGITPTVTAWLDALTLTTAGIALVLIPHWRLHPLTLSGLLLLAGGVWVSSATAGDGLAARLAGMNLVIIAIAATVLIRLFRDDGLRRAALAGVIAVTVASAYRCINQRYYEFPALLETWQEQKSQMIARGRPADDPVIENYERRMRSLESYGYHYHPNVAGSMLMAGTIVLGAGLLAVRVRRPAEPGAATAAQTRTGTGSGIALAGGGLACAVLGYALWLTGSNGALGALLLAALTAGVLFRFRERIGANPLRWTAIGIGLYLGILLGVAMIGVSRGTLPGSSLAFRWEYWSAALRAWEDAPLTGIGRENFQDAYCRFKSAAAVEEVRNPHNLWVSLLVETGPPGLLGGLILLVAWTAAALRSTPVVIKEAAKQTARGAWLIATVLVITLVLHLLLSWSPLTDPSLGFLWGVETAGVALVAGGIAWITLRAADDTRIGAVLLHFGGVAAVAGMLMHAWVDYALLTPAGAALFAILAAAAVRDQPREQGDGKRPRQLVRIGILGLLAADWFGVVRPSTQSHWSRWLLDQSIQRAETAEQAAENVISTVLLRDAVQPDTYARTLRAVHQLLSSRRISEPMHQRLLIETTRFLRRPIGNPHNANTWELRAQLLTMIANQGNPAQIGEIEPEPARQAYAAIRAAVECNPTNPRLRIRAAELVVRLADPLESHNPRLHDPEALRFARECLDEALRIHGLWKPEEVVRLRERELQRIEECGQDLKTLLRLVRPDQPADGP